MLRGKEKAVVGVSILVSSGETGTLKATGGSEGASKGTV